VLVVAACAWPALACEGASGRRGTAAPSGGRASRAPLLVVGVDGADWGVVQRLWAEGRLPHLKRLADGGASGVLKTAYGISPVIWTTIATGRTPDVHGITDFVVSTESGAVPVSSAVRRVPAVWNMASRAGRRTAVLGWWASWPAEAIEGVVVTDRAHLTRDRAVHPPAELAALERTRVAIRDLYPGLAGGVPGRDPWMEDGATRDRIMVHEGLQRAGTGFDLVMVYLRTVDIASHRYWKYFEPSRYPGSPRGEQWSQVIPTVYEATDQAIGDLVAACPAGTNVLLVSDHGFMAGPEMPMVYMNTERLLEHLGFLVRKGEAVDFARSVAYPVDSPGHARVKLLRLSRRGREPDGRVPASEVQPELARLTRALQSVTYADGGPVFTVRRNALPPQADLAADVTLTNASLRIRVGSAVYDDVVHYINSITGTHNETTDGMFVAWGPDIEPGSRPSAFSVLDVAPTILYALGLPVAEDFTGQARPDLFTRAFGARRPLRKVPSWGTMASWRVESSAVDAKLVDELRALGYVSP